jgi:hypothetical protein
MDKICTTFDNGHDKARIVNRSYIFLRFFLVAISDNWSIGRIPIPIQEFSRRYQCHGYHGFAIPAKIFGLNG